MTTLLRKPRLYSSLGGIPEGTVVLTPASSLDADCISLKMVNTVNTLFKFWPAADGVNGDTYTLNVIGWTEGSDGKFIRELLASFDCTNSADIVWTDEDYKAASTITFATGGGTDGVDARIRNRTVILDTNGCHYLSFVLTNPTDGGQLINPVILPLQDE